MREPDWKGAKERAQEILGAAEELENARGKALQTVEARATAYAVLGDVDKAARHFAELAGLEASTTDKLADIRHRAQFLAVAVGKPRDFFKGAFPPLQLIVFSGHAPDRPDQPPDQPGRFPPESIEPIRHTMAVKLDELKARVGLVSACAGGDLLFNEAMQARHGIVHLVLPWSGEEFRRTSVRPFERAGSPLWERLFESALDHAATIRTMGQVYEPSHDVGWEYMMEVTAGIALRTARARRLDIQPLALWDGQPGRGAGGTDAFVALWGEQLKRDVIVMKPPIAPAIHVSHSGLPGAVTERPIPYPVARRQRIQRTERPILQQEVKSLLFADIVGYSKLTEKAILEFVGVFLDRVSRLVASTQHAPFSLNTWGDAVYAVFDHGRDAGLFALELAELVEAGIRDGEWIGKGLYWEEQIDGESAPRKHPLNIRIGLHTGPVLMHYDPVVRMLGVTGTHVSRAARIEPVAMPGQVLASEEFAAMVDLSGEIQKVKGAGSGIGFACEYAGTMKLAKAYPGRHRIFRVVRKQAFALEELAKAAHADYCAEAKKRGETFETNSSLRPWEELPEDLRAANRSLAADIPFKLKELGFELAQTNGISAMEIPESGDRMERSAIREHDRWMGERMRNGWTYAEKRDNARKHHPSLVSWDRLPEVEKEKDREIIRSLRAQIERAGLRVRRLE